MNIKIEGRKNEGKKSYKQEDTEREDGYVNEWLDSNKGIEDMEDWKCSIRV